MSEEKIKLTEYLHNIIEENISLRKQNDTLWKQKLEYIGRINKAIELIEDRYYSKNTTDIDSVSISNNKLIQIRKILKGDVDE